MRKKLSSLAALCVLALVAGCTVSVVTPQTTIKAENDLTNVTVNLTGSSPTFTRIDLYGVTVGDAYFPYVEGGYVSATLVTNSSGTVNVSVDSALGYAGGTATYVFTQIPVSSVTLSTGVSNTAYFQGPSFLSGATATPKTKVQVENDLTNLSVDVGGVTTQVNSIELVGVIVGDVTFADVPGGTTSAAQTTNLSGTVNVTIDSVYVQTTALGLPVTLGFAVTAQMSATITPGITNTVIFDETTASAIIQSLAKRKAK
jgi:hypothetical protein